VLDVTSASVRAYFDREVGRGRRLLPDTSTVSGLGAYRKYHEAVELMASPAVSTVLDVGCNRGSIEFLFHDLQPAKANRTQVRGIDASSEAIRHARELKLPMCDFQVNDGPTLPYPSATFDLVVMVEVIEHVLDKERLLREVSRVLTPSGKLYLTTPNPECWPLQMERAVWAGLRTLFRRPDPAKDVFITQRALDALLASAGFRAADAPARFAWPHFFLDFFGWGVLPPLPPKVLYWYQRKCLALLDPARLPDWVNRRFQWSLVTVLGKSSAA